jgi:simple sugar transport system permease protein
MRMTGKDAMRLPRLEPRAQSRHAGHYVSPLLAAVLTILGGTVLFAALGFDPWVAFRAFFIKPLSTPYQLAEVALKASPLLLCALGLSIGFRCNVWNIGAEGQLAMGAVAGSAVALAFPESDSTWLLPGMILAGAAGGMVWAAIPALLRTRFNTNEILSSLMLTYVALLILSYLVHGPWRDPAGYNFPETRLFGQAALLPILIEGTRVNLGCVFALVATGAVWLLLERSFVGFQIKVVGLGPGAAAYAGFREPKLVWLSFLAGGGLAGVAGIDEVAGPIGQLLPRISPGYGFAAIIVAFVGRLHPVGILLASILMSIVYLGGESAQVTLGLPLAVAGVFQGMLLFFLLGCDFLVRYRLRFTLPLSVAA